MIFRGAIYLVNRGANSLSFSKQKQIGEIFSALDKKIELNRQINQNLPILDHSLKAVEVRLVA